MAAPRKYPDELRERAIRMAVDARRDPATKTGALKRIAGQLGINPETLRNWVVQAEVDAGDRPGTTTDDAARLAELEKEVRELRRANAILRSASGFLRGGARPPLPLTNRYIDEHKDQFGVEPICRELQIAPSTYYAAHTRPPSKRSVSDQAALAEIDEVHAENLRVYGARKLHAAINRRRLECAKVDEAPERIARCTVERLMRSAGLHGLRRSSKPPRTTVPAVPDHRPDLVQREFSADRPDRLWVADITYIRTCSGWVYAAFVQDVCTRRIMGWQVATHLRTELALDALQMAFWVRRREGADLTGLKHHSDKGVQYVAVRYTERLAAEGAVASVGSTGDSYDNAMAEAFNSLFKAECIRNPHLPGRDGPWRGLDDVERAVAGYLDWYNTRRLHGELGMVPPVEYQARFDTTAEVVAAA
ncbi:IS3 family transposase [Kineococcus arenarius]|uniref:IS3 family transposase n=1 Tax=unclassified Kineococcus TaxID=2621656 RepID=UPI003D7D8A7B